MSDQNKKCTCKVASTMLIILVILMLAILDTVNVKTIIQTGFNGIVFFKVIAIILFVSAISLNLISAFLYVAVMNSEFEAKGKFKAGNILFLIALCTSIVLFILVQCA